MPTHHNETLLERADELLDGLLDHDVGYEAQTGAAQIVDDMMAEIRRQSSEIERLEAIEAAARNLVKVKGRYHTEQAFKALAALLEKSNG